VTQAPRRILAIDFGEARTGLAATDWTGTIAVPLGRIDAKDDDALVAAIAATVRERETELVVLGMPLARDGSHGARARRTAAFRKRLEAALSCPVTTIDESHSTDEAHERLKGGGLKASRRKQLADSVAALVILERFRSSAQGRRAPGPGEP
jgi:putative Holliday junction resolvase